MNQQRNVVPALAQRRHDDVDHVEAVEQVLAKLSMRDELPQVAVGCRNHTNIDGTAATLGSHLLGFTGLQKPQQPRRNEFEFEGEVGMKKKSEKIKQAEEMKAQLATVSTVILSTFQGITVENDTRLRRAVEAAGGKYQVVKNTLSERAGEGTPAESLLKNLKGTNSISYTYTDPVALAKVLTKVAKEVPAFKFKAGWVEGRVVSIDEIQNLAQLPSKEEVISKVMFLLNAPAQRLASTLAAVPRNLAVVANEAVKSEKFSQS